jgi:hypothetical protein
MLPDRRDAVLELGCARDASVVQLRRVATRGEADMRPLEGYDPHLNRRDGSSPWPWFTWQYTPFVFYQPTGTRGRDAWYSYVVYPQES